MGGDVGCASRRGCSRGLAGTRLSTRTRQPLQRRRDQGGQPRGEGRQQVGQVGAGPGPPVPGHVGLTESDLRVPAEPGEERGGADDLELGRRRRAAAEHPPVGIGDADGNPATARSKISRATVARMGARGRLASAGQPMEVETVMFRHLPDGCGAGRERMGRPRSQSQMPCTRIRAETRWVIRGWRMSSRARARRLSRVRAGPGRSPRTRRRPRGAASRSWTPGPGSG